VEDIDNVTKVMYNHLVTQFEKDITMQP